MSFNEQKEFQKIEREIKDLEHQKKEIEKLFSEGKVADTEITNKAKELQNIINKMEDKEERWFELSETFSVTISKSFVGSSRIKKLGF